MKKLFFVFILLAALAIAFFGVKFSSALFQEEHTTEILTSIIKLEGSSDLYIRVNDTSNGVMYVSKNNRGSQEQIIKDFMAENGWRFKEQMGAVYFFEKDEDTLGVDTRQYTSSYFLWIVPKEAFS